MVCPRGIDRAYSQDGVRELRGLDSLQHIGSEDSGWIFP